MSGIPNPLPADPAVLAGYLRAMETARAYTFTIDQRDWRGYAALFGTEVTIDYKPRKPGIPTDRIPSAEWVEGAMHSLGEIEATHHMFLPYGVTFEGERATVFSHCAAHHFDTRVTGDQAFTEHATYRHVLRPGDGPAGWLIDEVHAEVLWSVGNRAVLYRKMEG